MPQNVKEWLEEWIRHNVVSPPCGCQKADMRDAAAACASEAQSVGISIAALKEAADGDLESYFLERRVAERDG